ncbi:hypothetical protein EK21DRAFT_116160 [Setomelanomma holmii]|uniref:Uncharacterized protein n=1 Tax=Setomelanomma holmii TaxID=210430 RepID=A0A9P4H092_9PLEO|nr:hypothetical protein EK21DRAFT_116160 [Setomelanomma holmii]
MQIKPCLYGVLMNFQGIAKLGPLFFLISIWAQGGSHTTVGRYVPKAIVRPIVPTLFLGYVLPTVLMFVPSAPNSFKQDLVLEWQFTTILVSILLFASTKMYEKNEKRSDFDVYTVDDVSHLITAYNITFAFSIAYHALTMALIMVATGYPVLSIIRLLLSYFYFPAPYPESQEVAIFTFHKLDFLFAFFSGVLYGLYNVYHLRYKALVTKQTAVVICAVFGIAQVVVGPGTAIVGLWWWRELRVAYPGKDDMMVKPKT